jgi:hypothetical protein
MTAAPMLDHSTFGRSSTSNMEENEDIHRDGLSIKKNAHIRWNWRRHGRATSPSPTREVSFIMHRVYRNATQCNSPVEPHPDPYDVVAACISVPSVDKITSWPAIRQPLGASVGIYRRSTQPQMGACSS